jgi:hypothetical protein
VEGVEEEETSMSKRILVVILAATGLVGAAGTGRFAFAKTFTPSGNMNLRLQGREVLGSVEDGIFAIGQVLADTAGNFSGDETFTYVNSASTSTGVCGGSITAGTIKSEGGSFGTLCQGQFNLSFTFTPQTVVSGTPCVASAITMLCNRTLVHPILIKDLNAGQYHCVVTGVTGTGISAASMDGHLDIVRGSNSPES